MRFKAKKLAGESQVRLRLDYDGLFKTATAAAMPRDRWNLLLGRRYHGNDKDVSQ